MTRSITEVTEALCYKSKQAEFFFDHLQMEINDEWAAACHFSACICALRSIPSYIRASLEERGQLLGSKCERDAAWGKLHGELCEEMSKDQKEVGQWLRAVANADIHRSPAELLKEIYGVYISKSYFPPSYFPSSYFPSVGGVGFSAIKPKSNECRNIIEACKTGISYAMALIDQFNKRYSDLDEEPASDIQSESEA